MFSVFKTINDFANRYAWLDLFAIFCARWLLYICLTGLFAISLLSNNWRLSVLPFTSGLLAAFGIDRIIYAIYKERRPAELPGTKILIPIPENPSFPSRHASLLFGIAFYLYLFNWPLATFFIVAASIVGLSRVFVGVHWFHDILAGILVGASSTLLIYSFLNYIKI